MGLSLLENSGKLHCTPPGNFELFKLFAITSSILDRFSTTWQFLNVLDRGASFSYNEKISIVSQKTLIFMITWNPEPIKFFSPHIFFTFRVTYHVYKPCWAVTKFKIFKNPGLHYLILILIYWYWYIDIDHYWYFHYIRVTVQRFRHGATKKLQVPDAVCSKKTKSQNFLGLRIFFVKTPCKVSDTRF